MRRAKAAGGLAAALAILVYVGYIGMHIYFAYVAFTEFVLWFAILVFVAPVAGDLLLVGACIAYGSWIPFIWLMAICIIVFAVELLSGKGGKVAQNGKAD